MNKLVVVALFSQPTQVVSKRQNVVIHGTTLRPGFFIPEGQSKLSNLNLNLILSFHIKEPPSVLKLTHTPLTMATFAAEPDYLIALAMS